MLETILLIITLIFILFAFCSLFLVKYESIMEQREMIEILKKTIEKQQETINNFEHRIKM